MKKLGLNDIREAYLSFFESKGHLRHGSYSLVPDGDRSVLLINAGMTPLKKYFTGEATPPRTRMTTCQKCIRTGDIDNVGKTARHGTYFEMLGNFSFGDYFKREAIGFAWEFLTKTLEMPGERLWITVYTEDDEAETIWKDEIGVPLTRIVRLGKKDNFWEHGSGPCGPCSEIHFDRGAKYGCGKADCAPGCDCDRFMEIWNLVFTQFDSDGKGTYTRLASPNIDTGMGLERLACIMQGVNNLFEVDTVKSIMNAVCALSGRAYSASAAREDVSLRVITDHIRSASFLVCDGVLPSNEGRGYVLRRLLRRAARHGRLLGIAGSFLAELAEIVARENLSEYPELTEKLAYVKRVIGIEEERFSATIDAGLGRLNEIIAAVKAGGGSTVSGEDAFRLHDTFGFPIDLTREIAAEAGLSVDDEGFAALIKEQKTRARAARGKTEGWRDSAAENLSALPKTEFVGYDYTKATAKVIAIIARGESVESFEMGEGNIDIVLDRTPCYGEGGGQVGDTGTITSAAFVGEITDTKKTGGVFIHKVSGKGAISVGDSVSVEVDKTRRDAVRRNHTATHLLQAALRTVLGEQVHQAGSLVSADGLRFDFTHFEAVSGAELAKIEQIVNKNILLSLPIATREQDVETARKSGATALFGEKYGAVVRVVSIGEGEEVATSDKSVSSGKPVSVELCGGTHLSNTSGAGLFKIISESSVASGVRRIEAVTGAGVLELIAENEKKLAALAEKLAAAEAETRRASERAQTLAALSQADALAAKTENVGGLKVIFARAEGNADALRTLSDKLRERADIVLLASVDQGKVAIVAACSANAVKSGKKAGELVKAAAAVCGGGGGGRPDFATAGGKGADKIEQAIKAARAQLTVNN